MHKLHFLSIDANCFFAALHGTFAIELLTIIMEYSWTAVTGPAMFLETGTFAGRMKIQEEKPR